MEEKCHDPTFTEKMQYNLTNKIFTFWEVNMDSGNDLVFAA